ncbi:MAG: glycosyltransferase, partial [Verrucomicrobia bacterium]|nr:glycosyltransferase [Verrucomicrobiota bacterium]
MTPALLTLAMIVRNEEAFLGRCLLSVKNLADEIIVVDTGSIDSTKQIALDAGAKIVDFPWCDDFSAARNAGLDIATGRWILVLDADEYLPESSVRNIREIITSDSHPNRAFHLLNKSTTDGGRTGIAGQIVRLFPNDPRIRYEWPVHEQVVTSIQRLGVSIENTSIEIIHTGYSSANVNAAKQTRNLRILEKMTSTAEPAHPMAWFLKGGALLDLGKTEAALSAYIQCAKMTKPRDSIHNSALVRWATCLSDLKRFDQIPTIHPQSPLSDWHPELLLLRAQAEIHLGDTQSGLEFLPRVFDSPPRPL